MVVAHTAPNPAAVGVQAASAAAPEASHPATASTSTARGRTVGDRTTCYHVRVDGRPPRTDAIEAPPAEHVLVRRFRLSGVAGPAQGMVHESAGSSVVIGSHQAANLVIDDATLSRFHCEISIADGVVTIRDLGSRNGTTVDGVQILAARLRSGCTLTLGRSRLVFDLGQDHVPIPISPSDRFQLLAGRSRAMRAVFAVLERAARGDSTVLLQGETGTGKDAAAESLHLAGARRDGPFVVVDCGALPRGLLESELFGHERGAFTGADRPREGAFEAASGGTLFIDEIGELSLDLQPALLRAIERREVQRVGSNQRRSIDVRVMAAANRNLRAEVNARRFRADLYYRLAVIEVSLPPLRERIDDLPLLVETLLERIGAKDGPAGAALMSPSSLDELARHPWPGNVRELRNFLERTVALEERAPLPPPEAAGAPFVDVSLPLRVAREGWVRAFERRYLEEILRRNGDNVTAAARAAGVDRIHFHRLLSRAGLR